MRTLVNAPLAILLVLAVGAETTWAIAAENNAAPESGQCEQAPASMRAVRLHAYGGPEALRVEEIAVPSVGPDEVLIRMQASSVNPIDWKLREGEVRSWWPLTFPATLGRDGAGVVVAVGHGVEIFRCGDPVVVLATDSAQGTHSEYMAASVRDVAHKPDRLSFGEAAAYPLVAITALAAVVHRAQVTKGETVLVHGGAGGVGSMAVQIASARGAHVIATASGRHSDFVASLGADEVIDYRRVRFEDAVSNVDVVIDTVGGDTLARSIAVVRPGGRLVSIAGSVGQDACEKAGIECPAEQETSLAQDFREIEKLFDSGSLRVEIESTFPLAETAVAQERNRAGGAQGKLIIVNHE